MNNVPTIISVREQVVRLHTAEEKIKYCAKMIYDTHSFLRNNTSEIARIDKLRAMGIIRFAEKELFQLIKK
jgi:hypothetical protein